MNTQYRCKNQARRKKVEESAIIDGIDFLEVSADELTLSVHMLHPRPSVSGTQPDLSKLSPNNFLIQGGVRIRNPKVTSVSASDNIITVKVEKAGDFSTYSLRILDSPLRWNVTKWAL